MMARNRISEMMARNRGEREIMTIYRGIWAITTINRSIWEMMPINIWYGKSLLEIEGYGT